MSTAWWFDEQGVFDSLVVLTDEMVYVGSPSAELGRQLVAQLEQGEPPAQILKDDVAILALFEINRVRWNQKDDDIDLRSTKGNDTTNIDFASPVARDEFAEALSQRLIGFESRTVAFSRFRAMLGPLGFGSGAAGLTWVFHQAALALQTGQEATIEGRHRGMKRLLLGLLDVIGPTGVLIAGGIVVLCTGLFLARRVGDPPVITTLEPSL